MTKPEEGSSYDGVILRCSAGEDHDIHVMWVESLQRFVFSCLHCDMLTGEVSILDANNIERRCELREIKQ